jgi:GT2 family glycosyltransferase
VLVPVGSRDEDVPSRMRRGLKPLAIIPNYVRTIEDCQLLSVCLTTLRDTVGDDCDVMVVDDGSSEADLVTYCQGLTEAVGGEFRARQENGGFSRAVNEGLRVALRDDRDAILVNADIQFTTKTWLKLMLKQRTSDDSGLASVVGALLSYPNGLIQHGGVVFSLLTRDFSHRYNYGPENLPEAQVATVGPVTGALMFIRHECLQNVGLFDETFCSPGDEPVLTALDGYVPIGELDGQGLVGVSPGGKIVRCRGNRQYGGFPYQRSASHFDGDLVVIETESCRTRVTPGHRLRVRWTEKALSKQAVYLMRRGRDWRIGTAAMSTRAARTFGPRVRQGMEAADAFWVLKLCADKTEACLQESAWSVDYGIPQTSFVSRRDDGLRANNRSQRLLDEFWLERNSERGALLLLAACGRDSRYPLCGEYAPKDGVKSGYMGGAYHGMVTHACNLITGEMSANIDPGSGALTERELVQIATERFDGTVYGLDVPPHHFYVSGGVVVHNSLGWEDIDYGVRVWLSGRECIYQPGVRAIHHESFFRGRADEKIQRWTNESWLRFCAKYGQISFAQFVPSLTIPEEDE